MKEHKKGGLVLSLTAGPSFCDAWVSHTINPPPKSESSCLRFLILFPQNFYRYSSYSFHIQLSKAVYKSLVHISIKNIDLIIIHQILVWPVENYLIIFNDS